MKRLTIAIAAACLLGSAAAAAGPGGTSCATAEQLSAGETGAGDTSSTGYANNTNDFGPVPSPAADAYYTFVSDGAATTSVDFNFSYDGGAVLTTDCNLATNDVSGFLQAAGGTGAVSLTIDNGAGGALTAGTTYYVIVTGNPTGDSTDVGGFTYTAPTPLPVELQSMSVD